MGLANPRPQAAHRPVVRGFLLLITAAIVLVLLGLGTWQVQRRQWKLDLIERTTQRVQAPVTAAPGPAIWPQINPAGFEYSHITARGTWLQTCAAWTQAVTDLGAGYWLLMPLKQADGSVVLINRGFIAEADKNAATAALADQPNNDSVAINGLLRITEPHGGFLRHNDPATGHWYSRDVEAIARNCHLSNTAPYFIDADAGPVPFAHGPVAGLTVVSFHNNHLVYALTWYALALMMTWGGWRLLREPAG